jgi:flagellar basal-body rod protein FlgB
MLDGVAKSIESYMTALSVRERVIGANVANADTPGYRTRDVDFEHEFKRALKSGSPEITEVSGLQLKNDGNNVSVDREMRALSETALRFNIASNFVRSEIKQIRLAMDQGGQ